MNLKIQHFRSLKEVDLPLEGVIHISGPPGSGRTSLKIALDHLLFGMKDGLEKGTEIVLGDIASINRQGRFIADSGTDEWAENQRLLRGHLGSLGLPHNVGFTSQHSVHDFAASIYSSDSRDGVLEDLGNLVDRQGFGLGAAVAHSTDLKVSRGEVIRILVTRLAEILAKLEVELNRARFRLEPEDGRIAKTSDENLVKNRTKAQKDINALSSKVSILEGTIVDCGKEEAVRAMARKADVLDERSKALHYLRSIESEQKRRVDIYGGLEEDIKARELDALSLNETLRVLASPELRFASNSKYKELWDSIRSNASEIMDIGGFDAPKFTPSGEILVMDRPLNRLSHTEKFQWELACTAALLKFVKFPWLIVDGGRLPAWTRNWIWGQRLHFECVVMMEQSFDGGDRSHYGADTCLWLENGTAKERATSTAA